MKKRLGMFTLIVVVLLASLVTMAPGPGPTPEPADCSPGFWKNHLDAWSEDLQDSEWKKTGMTWLEALQGGKETRFTRHEVANKLNAKYPLTVCE